MHLKRRVKYEGVDNDYVDFDVDENKNKNRN